MPARDLLFLGGFGAPSHAFYPWFKTLRNRGYRVHSVPNSLLSTNSVSAFAESFSEEATHYETFDVVGVSYGGNAAMYGAHLSREVREKTGKMIAVCAPLLGTPAFMDSALKLAPGFLAESLEEMREQSDVVWSIRELAMQNHLPFELHCIYHERDLIAPPQTATLPGVAVSHRLDFQWKLVPRMFMHQAACANPRTLNTLLEILDGT